MFLLRTLALAVTAGLLAGCAVGPDYQRPDAPLAKRYQAQSAIQQRSASRSASFAVWWEGFDDPLLSQLVSDALAQNLDLARATARMQQARAGLGAATAALLPSGNFSGQAARAYQSTETPLGQVLSTTPDYNRYGNSYETDLNASWEIDIFGGLRRERQAAQADYQASEAGVVATRLAVAAQTADIYITLRGLQTRGHRGETGQHTAGTAGKGPPPSRQRTGARLSGASDRRGAGSGSGHGAGTPDGA